MPPRDWLPIRPVSAHAGRIRPGRDGGVRAQRRRGTVGDTLPGVIAANASLSDAEVAIAAARAGAAVVRGMYGRRLARIDEGGGDFATTADVAAEQAILDVIRAARPQDAMVGEEGGRQGGHGAAREWLVDPLCGTRNYAAGTMLVAVKCGAARWGGSGG